MSQTTLKACKDSKKRNNCFDQLILEDYSVYEGEFKNNLFHGKGKFYDNYKGTEYVGEFKNSLFNGKGSLTYNDNSKYVGEFKDDLPDGKGIYTNIDGNIYNGDYKKGVGQGFAVFTTKNGYKYEGQFSNNMRHGLGIETYPDGDKFIGEFVNGESANFGTYEFKSGNRYVGNFSNGTFNGKGIYYNKYGDMTHSGIWEDGLHKHGFVIPTSEFPYDLADKIIQSVKYGSCLRNSTIGVCIVNSSNKTKYICGAYGIQSGMALDPNCHINVPNTTSIKLITRNNFNHPIKDITFNCSQFGRSGTFIGDSIHTIYDMWLPNAEKIVDFDFLKYDQVVDIICKASKWEK